MTTLLNYLWAIFLTMAAVAIAAGIYFIIWLKCGDTKRIDEQLRREEKELQ